MSRLADLGFCSEKEAELIEAAVTRLRESTMDTINKAHDELDDKEE